MGDHVSDNFYEHDSVFHRVSAVSYGSDSENARTFCSEEFEMSDESEIITVPIHLLDRNSVCLECERNYDHIQFYRFSFGDTDGNLTFFFEFSIRTGENTGQVIRETVDADSKEEAKEKIKRKYSLSELSSFNYISKSEEYGEWSVLVDRRRSESSLKRN